MNRLRLRFLGGIIVEQDGEQRSDKLPGKALAMLCYLAVTGEAQTRSALAGLLWSDFPEHRARSNLRDTLALLRRTTLAPYLNIGRRLITLNQDLSFWVDTAAFEKGINDGGGRQLSDPPAIESAIELYRGEFLAGFRIQKAALFEEWATVQRQQLHLTAVRGLERLVEHHLDGGSYARGITHATHLLTLDPWREETHRKLMLLYLLKGEHHSALKQYETCGRILADEIGVDPSPETHRLAQNIRQQLGRSDPAWPTAAAPGPISRTIQAQHNIPGQVTPFIGREMEQRAIDIVLGDRDARLITIFGVGGSGKTRLALATGRKQIERIERDGRLRFADGVFFVPLEAVESTAEIIPALCQAVGFQPVDENQAGQSMERQLLNHLGRKHMLLLIDNFEQLLDGAGLLAKILHAAPDVQMLVTTRQRLGLQGERLYSLEGLLYPQEGEAVDHAEQLIECYAAAALFVASARRVKSEFQLFDREVPQLIKICRLLDGLPLAIELAAGWVNLLPLGDIAAEIELGLSFLASDLRDLPDRHRSMKATFEVSWRRISSADQTAFAQLCIFRGGFKRQTAVQVVGISLRQLANLANRALIQFDRKTDRYQVHRLLRQYGAEKLSHDPGAGETVRDRHCAHFCAALQQWEKQLKGARQMAALAEMDSEAANARAAWHFAVNTGQWRRLDQAADGLGLYFLWRRNYREGEAAGGLAAASLTQIQSIEKDKLTAAKINRTAAKLQIWQSVFCEQSKAIGLVRQALKILESPALAKVDSRRERAFGYQRAGDLTFNRDAAEARRLYILSLELYRELDDAWGMAKLLTLLGWGAAHHGGLADARNFGEEALSLLRRAGDQKGTADVLWLLGTLAILDGEIEDATRLLGESLDLREKMGDRITDITTGPLDLGMTLTWIGRMAEADAIREETLALYEAQGQPEQIALAHVRLATSKLHVGQFEAAKKHARIGLEQCRKIGSQRGAGLALWILGSVPVFARDNLDAKRLLQESLASLQKVEGAVEAGWILGSLAVVARRQGQVDEAKRYICDALRTASGVLGLISLIFGVTVYIDLLIDEGQEEKALEMTALLRKYPMFTKSPAFAIIRDEPRLCAIESAWSPEVAFEVASRGRARDLQETAAEILMELDQ